MKIQQNIYLHSIAAVIFILYIVQQKIKSLKGPSSSESNSYTAFIHNMHVYIFIK